MNCKNCGAKLTDNSKFCTECGTATRETQETSTTSLEMQEQPVATKPNKRNKGCFTKAMWILVIILVIIAGLLFLGIHFLDKASEEYKLDVYEELQSQADMSADVADAVMDVFEMCAIGEIITFERDVSLDDMYAEGQTGYRMQSNVASNLILYLNADGSVYALRYKAEDLYLDGEFIAKVTDFVLLDGETSKYYAKSQTVINECLKSPSTAEYPFIDEWSYSKSNGIITVSSYVDAQNSFGAMIRSNFTVQFDTSTDTVVSLVFDGEKII